MKELDRQIEVMQHFKDGGEVSVKYNKEQIWGNILTPQWDWVNNDYRIKKAAPEPVYYYRWKMLSEECIHISTYTSEQLAGDWIRIESSKTTFEELI